MTHSIGAAQVQGDLDSFLIEISSLILPKKDDKGEGYLVDKILDKTGMKGTGGCTQISHFTSHWPKCSCSADNITECTFRPVWLAIPLSPPCAACQ